MSVPRKPRAQCLCGCGREVASPAGRFFSNKCQQDFEYLEYIEEWKAGFKSGDRGGVGTVSRHIKRYLVEKYCNRCSNCGWAMSHTLTGNVPLELDHVNGDAS